MEKDLDEWNKIKKVLNNHFMVPLFSEREIWWCSIRLNHLVGKVTEKEFSNTKEKLKALLFP